MQQFLKALIAIVVWSIMTTNIAYAKKTEIDSVRYGNANNYSRIVFDLSGSATYQFFLLTKPSRLVVDFKNTILLKPLYQPVKTHALLNRVRSAVRNKTDLRVVVDLKAKVTPKLFTLKPNKKQGHRLVLDLTPKNSNKSKQTEKESPKHLPIRQEHNKNSELLMFSNSPPHIRMYRCLDKNWLAVGKALGHDFDIIEKDQNKSVFFVRYKSDPNKGEENSLWSDTLSFFGSIFSDQKGIKVKLIESNHFTEVSIANENKGLDSSQQEKDILELIFKGIKKDNVHENIPSLVILDKNITKEPEQYTDHAFENVELVEQSHDTDTKMFDGLSNDYYVDFVSFAGGIPRVRIENTMNYSWEIVERALAQQPVNITDRNKVDAVFIVHYEKGESYFWKKNEFKIKLVENGVLTEVFIFDENDIPLLKGAGAKLLESLYYSIEKSSVEGEQ